MKRIVCIEGPDIITSNFFSKIKIYYVIITLTHVIYLVLCGCAFYTPPLSLRFCKSYKIEMPFLYVRANRFKIL